MWGNHTVSDQNDTESDEMRVDGGRATWRRVGDELVVLDLTDSTYLSINETGAAVWPLLEKGARREQLLDLILERFEVDRADAARDLDAFLADLRSRGLLVTPSGG